MTHVHKMKLDDISFQTRVFITALDTALFTYLAKSNRQTNYGSDIDDSLPINV